MAQIGHEAESSQQAAESVLPPPLASWPYSDEEDDDEGEEAEAGAPAAAEAGSSSSAAPWNAAIWNIWTPGFDFKSTTELPPVAVAALADAMAKGGQSPSLIIAGLREELADSSSSESTEAEEAAMKAYTMEFNRLKVCGAFNNSANINDLSIKYQ